MNVKLLRKIQKYIKSHPRKFDMDTYFDSKDCGCFSGIATCGLKLGSLKENGFSYGEISRLIAVEAWPQPFRSKYYRSKAKTGIARIDHFIKTKGNE